MSVFVTQALLRQLLVAPVLWTLLLSPSLSAATILLDPGHGGSNRGAIGYRSMPSGAGKEVFEKDLTLAVAKKIKEALSSSSEHRVFLSRSVDRDISLEERADLAEKVGADVVVSIHVNSSSRRSARGFETYYLDNHQDGAVRKLEAVENKNLRGEELVVEQILMDLVIDKTVETSKALASSIHNQIKQGLRQFPSRDRGIRPGLFFILALAKRPAVLLEIGFISNPEELEMMGRDSFRQAYAKAVARGLSAYLAQ